MTKKSLDLKNITIKDIAKKANVGVSTVSRVLNSSAPVSKQTKKKVLMAIEQMNYIPNEMARGLVKRNSKSIAFMIPEIQNPFYPEILQSIEEVTSKHGFSLSIYITNQDPNKEKYYLDEMYARRMSGVIIICTSIQDKEFIKKVQQRMEILSIHADIDDVDYIDTDSRKGTREIVNYLISLGHTKIGFIGYRFNITALNNRLMGYMDALKEHNIPVNPEYIIEGLALENPGYNTAKRLLQLKDRPTAIHCFNEYVACGAYAAIKEAKLRIPEDISITGYDNLKITGLLSPSLTTVAQPIATMGRIASEMLIKNILGRSVHIKQSIMLPTELIIRDSACSPK
ncbi:MAG: LacI family DNA-binding transcriptional regulator [Bacillota bacterium]